MPILSRSKSLGRLRLTKESVGTAGVPRSTTESHPERFTTTPVAGIGLGIDTGTGTGTGIDQTVSHIQPASPTPSPVVLLTDASSTLISTSYASLDLASSTHNTAQIDALDLGSSTGTTIGMAVGSPNQFPAWSPNPRSYTSITSGGVASPRSGSPVEGPQLPKISRWKSIFGRKQPGSSPIHTDSQAQRSQYTAPGHSIPRTFSPTGEVWESKNRPRNDSKVSGSPLQFELSSRQDLRDQSRPKPGPLNTSNLYSSTTAARSADVKRQEYSPRPPPKDFSPVFSPPNGSKISSPLSAVSTSSPLLDVDIPTCNMDRYSVMFSSLLKPESQQSSNLYVRRQGNAEKLKPLVEMPKRKEVSPSRKPKPPQRRETTISVSRSPALLIFPPSVPTPHRQVLTRSNTAPGALSPNRATFERNHPPRKSSKKAPDAPLPVLPAYGDTLEVSQAKSPSPSEVTFDESGDEITIMMAPSDAGPWRPNPNEPAWEIMVKPTAQSKPQAGPPPRLTLKDVQQRKPHQEQLPQAQRAKRATNVPGVPSTIPEVEVVKFSTARSISVSRRKPQLVKPVKVDTAAQPKQPVAPSRLVDHRINATPVIVEMGLHNRKSQAVSIIGR